MNDYHMEAESENTDDRVVIVQRDRYQIWWCFRCDAVWAGPRDHDCPAKVKGAVSDHRL